MRSEFKTDEANAPDGTPWWLVRTTPGGTGGFGGEKRISAYLNFNIEVGERFTMRLLREELGTDGIAEDAEHLNRRLRELRKDDWIIASYKDDRRLPADTYRLDAVGTRVWLGERNPRDKVSNKARRLLFERDHHTCQVCGIVRGDEYADSPGVRAKLTVGHRIPGERLRGASLDELQTECSRCNEPLRDLVPNPESFDEVFVEVRSLQATELRQLRTWVANGRRSRSRLDLAYARIRYLPYSERGRMVEAIDSILGGAR